MIVSDSWFINGIPSSFPINTNANKAHGDVNFLDNSWRFQLCHKWLI